MPDSIQQRIACRAVVFNGERILIIRESDKYADGTNTGKYDFPGGKIHPGEKVMDALKREVLEEAGLVVTSAVPFYVDEWNPVVHGQAMQIIGIFFLCAVENTVVALGNDFDAFEWILPAEAENYPLMRGPKISLQFLPGAPERSK